MKFGILYTIICLGASVVIGSLHMQEIKNNPPAPVIPETHFNVSFGPKNIVSAYPITGIDFTLKFSGTVAIGSDNGLEIHDAEVFQLSATEWTADMGDGRFVTVDVATGETTYNLDGRPHTLCPENSKP